eukprot:1448655-Ditylum_brightwellii.AAC.1
MCAPGPPWIVPRYNYNASEWVGNSNISCGDDGIECDVTSYGWKIVGKYIGHLPVVLKLEDSL